MGLCSLHNTQFCPSFPPFHSSGREMFCCIPQRPQIKMKIPFCLLIDLCGVMSLKINPCLVRKGPVGEKHSVWSSVVLGSFIQRHDQSFQFLKHRTSPNQKVAALWSSGFSLVDIFYQPVPGSFLSHCLSLHCFAATSRKISCTVTVMLASRDTHHTQIHK